MDRPAAFQSPARQAAKPLCRNLRQPASADVYHWMSTENLMPDDHAAQSVRINLKAVLLLVIIACAAVVGFSKLHARLARERTMVVYRGPLSPLTPPITADDIVLMADLRARNFDKLEAKLMAYQSAAERDVTQEANMVHAFRAFAREDPAFDASLQEWVQRSPNSYVAHLARSEFLFARGANARGDKWATETSDEQFQRMKDYFDAGEKEARSALAIDPKLAEAYALLVTHQRSSGGPEYCVRAAETGIEQVPASFVIRDETTICLKPRWGGSYEAMERFAAQAQLHVHENPELAALNGSADNDRGELLSNDGNYDAAIAYFSRAIAKGGGYSSFYYRRGEALMRDHRYAEALEDLRRADQLSPQDPGVLELISYVLLVTGKPTEALTEINLAEDLEGPVPYEQQLRARSWLCSASIRGIRARPEISRWQRIVGNRDF
jgi:tetratricopeptide (TPR) repeat protein